MSELPFRKNVSIVIINSENKVLLGERFQQNGIWQFPQGGVEDGDTLEKTVYKEIEEELGLSRSSVEIIKKLEAVNCYAWKVIPPHFQGIYQGQDQTFWLVDLVDPAAPFYLEQDNQEFQQVKWFEPHDILGIVEKVRVPGYTPVIAEVNAFINSERKRK